MNKNKKDIIDEVMFIQSAYQKAIANKKGLQLVVAKAEFITIMKSMTETDQISEQVFEAMVNKITDGESINSKSSNGISPSCGSSRASSPSCGSSRASSPSCGSSRAGRC